MIGVGVVGYGYWGPNLVRNFADNPRVTLVSVCDLRPERLAHVQSRYPTVEITTDFETMLADPRIDAIAVATPVSAHYRLALRALEAGKHVLVEKPLTSTSQEAEHLLQVAAERNRVLMVDHTFVYTGAVRRMRDLVRNGHLGELYYYDSVRVNLGLFQHDVSVIWDLAVHDLSIMDFVIEAKPVAVSATGVSHVPGQPENLAYITLFFESTLIAHLHVNWLAPVKVRRTLVGGSQRMIVYDDLEPSEKVKVYDRGITLNPSTESVYQMLIGYRTGDMWAPQLDMTEALKGEINHFVDCIESGCQPQTDGPMALRVIRILEAASRSLSERGQLVELPRERA